MDIATRKLMKKKQRAFKELSLKLRDILFFNANCFGDLMTWDARDTFDYQSFFEFVATEELLSDLKRYRALKGPFLKAWDVYKSYQQGLMPPKALERVDFSVSPDQLLQQIGFFYDIYLKSKALETYYGLFLKIKEGKKLQKNEEKKFKSIELVSDDLENYLVQNKLKAVEKMFMTYGEGRILFASKRVQTSLQRHQALHG